MKKRTILGTDLQLAPVCLGTDYFGTRVKERDAFALVDRFLEKGGNVVDTAEVYAAWVPGGEHRSEELLGEYLQSRKNRAGMVLSTKGAHPHLESMHIPRMSRQEIESDLDSSLKRLKVDCVDLYWVHRDDPGTPVEEILLTLEALRQQGKFRYAGFSNWIQSRAEEARVAAERLGIPGFFASQNQWSLARADAAKGDPTWAYIDPSFVEWHAVHGMAAFAYTAQASGYFRRLERDSLDQAPTTMRDLFHHEENQRRFRRIQKLAGETGYTITQIVLGYLINHRFPVFPIVGPKTLWDLDDALSAADVNLTSEQLQFLAPQAQ